MFRFRLEKVLQLKMKLRDAKMAELGDVESQISLVEREIDKVINDIKSISFPNRVVSFAEVGSNFELLSALRDREKALKDRLAALYREKDKIIEELIELQKEVKILEKLKQKKYEEFRREVLKKEIKRLDEFASQRREQ